MQIIITLHVLRACHKHRQASARAAKQVRPKAALACILYRLPVEYVARSRYINSTDDHSWAAIQDSKSRHIRQAELELIDKTITTRPGYRTRDSNVNHRGHVNCDSDRRPMATKCLSSQGQVQFSGDRRRAAIARSPLLVSYFTLCL